MTSVIRLEALTLDRPESPEPGLCSIAGTNSNPRPSCALKVISVKIICQYLSFIYE